MTPEEKQLLLRDLCGRQFYETKVLSPWEKDGPCKLSAIDLTSSRQIRVFEDWFKVEEVKPYLRPMSSMTEGERKEYKSFIFTQHHEWDGHGTSTEYVEIDDVERYVTWLNKHHFDYRGLLPMGLALEAPKDMYKN